MLRILSTLSVFSVVAILTLNACSSGKAAFERGDYYQAVVTAVGRLRKDPGNKKSTETLRLAYPLAVKYYEDQVNASLMSTAQFKWTQVVNSYTSLNSMYDEIQRSPGALAVIPNATNYNAKLNEARQNAAKEQYDAGTMALGMGTRDKAKEAYAYFKRSIEFVPGYRDAVQKMDEALWAATVKVLVEPIPVDARNLSVSADFFNDRVSEYLHTQNSNPFVRFFTAKEAQQINLNPDHIVRLTFDEFTVGNVYMSEKQIPLQRDSVVVATYVTNNLVNQNTGARTGNSSTTNNNTTTNNTTNNTTNTNTTNNTTTNTTNNSTTNNTTNNNNTTTNQTTPVTGGNQGYQNQNSTTGAPSNQSNQNTGSSNTSTQNQTTTGTNQTNPTTNNTTQNTQSSQSQNTGGTNQNQGSQTNTSQTTTDPNQGQSNQNNTDQNSGNNTENQGSSNQNQGNQNPQSNSQNKGNSNQNTGNVNRNPNRGNQGQNSGNADKNQGNQGNQNPGSNQNNGGNQSSGNSNQNQGNQSNPSSGNSNQNQGNQNQNAGNSNAGNQGNDNQNSGNSNQNQGNQGNQNPGSSNETQGNQNQNPGNSNAGNQGNDQNSGNSNQNQGNQGNPNSGSSNQNQGNQNQNPGNSNGGNQGNDNQNSGNSNQNQGNQDNPNPGSSNQNQGNQNQNSGNSNQGNSGGNNQNSGNGNQNQSNEPPIVADPIPANEQVTVCHIPLGNPAGRHSLTIAKSALKAHLDHGDIEGSCEDPKNADKFKELDKKGGDKKEGDKKEGDKKGDDKKDNKDNKGNGNGGFVLNDYSPLLIASASNDMAWQSIFSYEAPADTNKVYASVKATLYYYAKTIQSNGIVNFSIIDARTNAVLSVAKMPGEYIWKSEWATFNGDERALSAQHKQLIQMKEQVPPSYQQLFQAFTNPIFDQAMQKIQEFYKRY